MTGPRRRRTILAVPACCALVAGCGGGGGATTSAANPKAVAQRVCEHARSAAQSVVRGRVAGRVASSDPSNLECRLHAGAIRLDLIAQASPQAWAQFDTTQVHQDQAYGSGSRHVPSQIPKDESEGSMVAGWIAATNELFATNGSPTRGGSYVTVTVAHGGKDSAAKARLARAVARSALAVAPRGPNPASS